MSAGEIRLVTYPDRQTIQEGREVVFQCRDEGPLRVRVRWVRASDLPFPPGTTDIGGRLEMPNIQIAHTGYFMCAAVGYDVTASVYLRVIRG